VGGEVIHLKTDGDVSDVENIARYVDDKLKGLPPLAKLQSKRDFILLAMSMAGELFEAKKELESMRQQVVRTQVATQKLVDSIDVLGLEKEQNLP
jgi:cell division protein ZapA (FtsZ GTPase activity inhibitor)